METNKFIPIAEPDIGPKEIEYIKKAAESGWVSSLGYYVDKFEKDFSQYCGRKYGVSVSSGTAALHLALGALGIEKEDEVIIPNFTFIAVANTVLYQGAKPVLVDIEQDTWNIDPQKIEEKITPRTKVIIPVHIYGHSADMDSILEIAKNHSLKIVEDSAEAHSSEYKGKKCGSFGDISCFSFYGNKTITTGEGGMCLTDNEELYKKMLLLRDHGMRKEKKYWHEVIGYNYRLTNLQAALGCAQLERIEEFVEKKRNNAQLYMDLLKGIPWIALPIEKEYAKSNFWLFSVLINEKADFNRDWVAGELKKANIDTRVTFYPVSDMPPYKRFDTGNLEVSKRIAYQGLSLPSSAKLKAEEIKYICNILKDL